LVRCSRHIRNTRRPHEGVRPHGFRTSLTAFA
jgi:hypothetical protein